jgi:hypothetical protein
MPAERLFVKKWHYLPASFFSIVLTFLSFGRLLPCEPRADFTALGPEISFTHWYQKVLMVKK